MLIIKLNFKYFNQLGKILNMNSKESDSFIKHCKLLLELL